MTFLAPLAGLFIILWTLLDAFEQVILPRSDSHPFRISSLILRFTWPPWRAVARRIKWAGRRSQFLSYYGPLSVLVLLGAWGGALITGFALGRWTRGEGSFVARFYISGSNFFTLGLSRPPQSGFAMVVTVLEAGIGLAFLAAIIGYLPVYYSAYSQREAFIPRYQSLAGNPPTGGEVIRCLLSVGDKSLTLEFLLAIQSWAANVLQSHRAYKLVAMYRSQKGNSSWLAVLVSILDANAVALTLLPDGPLPGAQAAMDVSRRVATDLVEAFGLKPEPLREDRLPREAFLTLYRALASSGRPLRDDAEFEAMLGKVRATYEPCVCALADFLLVKMPPWIIDPALEGKSPGERIAEGTLLRSAA